MCGILVEYRRDSPAPELDTAILRHRGPDAAGAQRLADGKLFFGHTRLSILDPSPDGNQPMHDPKTGNWICYNGEIYNHRDLRVALPQRPWQSTSDTETLLAAYAYWGTSMLEHLEGMYAFVLFDAASRQIFAARDPLGIKPLYWRRDDQGVRFASEYRCLVPTEEKAICPTALSGYLRNGAFPDSAMPTASVACFPAGHYLVHQPDETTTPIPFWPRPSSLDPPMQTPVDPGASIRRALRDTIQKHLLSDVSVASFLSGGIDSTIVTTLAAQEIGEELQAITIGLPGFSGDETDQAIATAKRIGCRHHLIRVDQTAALEGACEAVEKMDLPSVDAINSYLVAKQTATAGIKVSLTGLGGDELFGGYGTFRDVPKLARMTRLPRAILHALALTSPQWRRLSDLSRNANQATLAQWRRFFITSKELKELGLPTSPPSIPPPPPELDAFSQISWTELSGYTRSMLLRDTDQMTMAVSLEARVPLLDLPLVEHVLSLPETCKRGNGLKPLLVAACHDLLPAECLSRPKQGFELPMAAWIEGPLADFAQAGIDACKDRAPILARRLDAVQKMHRERRVHWTRPWLIIVLGHYMQRHRYHYDPQA